MKRPAYVLVTTLALLSLAVMALAGFARHSLRLALRAEELHDELEARWALVSCRRVLLDRAEEILQAQVPPDQRSTPPWPKPAEITAAFQLGGHEYTVRLADEDAKVNLNAVHKEQPAKMRGLVRQHTDRGSRSLLFVQLRPNEYDPRAKPEFRSWGEVFDLTGATVENPPAALADATRELTLWGSGRLNIRRASDEAIRTVASLAVTSNKVGELIELRRTWGDVSLSVLLRQLELRQRELGPLRRLLTDQSSAHSLWVADSLGERTSWTLFVRGGRNSGRPDVQVFAW